MTNKEAFLKLVSEEDTETVREIKERIDKRKAVMTPKDKAKELVDWFLDEGLHEFGRYQSTVTEDLEGAKFCANKIVDEILDTLKEVVYGPRTTEYWQEVKTEIEKL